MDLFQVESLAQDCGNLVYYYSLPMNRGTPVVLRLYSHPNNVKAKRCWYSGSYTNKFVSLEFKYPRRHFNMLNSFYFVQCHRNVEEAVLISDVVIFHLSEKIGFSVFKDKLLSELTKYDAYSS